MVFCLCGLSPQNTQPQPNHERHIRQIPVGVGVGWGDILQYLTSTAQNCQVIKKNKESLRNCHSQEEPKEAWWLNVVRNPGRAPGTEKDMK